MLYLIFVIIIFNYYNYNISFLNKWKITTCFNPNHPSMAHLVACDYPKCSRKCSHKLGFHVILRTSMAMDEKFFPSHKFCNYTFNFMAMSCLLRLIILWHLSSIARLFLITCVHNNYKWVANLVVDFQIPFSVLSKSHKNYQN